MATNEEIRNKIVLITGGSRGLGKNMAIEFAKNKVDVILTYLNKQKEAQEVVNEIESYGQKASCLQLDVGKISSFDQFIEILKEELRTKFNASKFDYLINNAGIGATIMFTQVTEDQFDQFLNIHFKGVFFLTQKTINLINDEGRIINISSGTTRFCNPGYSIYASMKSALETFTRYLAKELGSRRITANVVAPGPVETDFNNALVRSNDQVNNFLSSITALGRVGKPDDISGIIIFLCSKQGYWINGQRIEVSGGINL
eukprot:TRINITY_DN4_c1_g1_i1.p1 TRINITY_DN4_c1_g1~~TRINITY_DN4_c1_g1_i1.p1  ORF type:complete len:259 (-),score=118.49 TRINITY_DN4_c1_g1_i1:145-921(-)